MGGGAKEVSGAESGSGGIGVTGGGGAAGLGLLKTGSGVSLAGTAGGEDQNGALAGAAGADRTWAIGCGGGAGFGGARGETAGAGCARVNKGAPDGTRLTVCGAWTGGAGARETAGAAGAGAAAAAATWARDVSDVCVEGLSEVVEKTTWDCPLKGPVISAGTTTCF